MRKVKSTSVRVSQFYADFASGGYQGMTAAECLSRRTVSPNCERVVPTICASVSAHLWNHGFISVEQVCTCDHFAGHVLINISSTLAVGPFTKVTAHGT